MYGAIYAADSWCADCAENIKQRIRDEGFAPKDEDDQGSYDSDEFPKDCDISCESDVVEHCAAGEDCINALDLDGFKIGCWLENDLTSVGENYVIMAVHEGGVVADLWAEYYDYLDFSITLDCEDDCEDVFDNDIYTDVVFLRHPNNDNVFAVFPFLPTTDYLVTCYEHDGQHSGASLWYCDECDEITNPTEYADLANELTHIGYQLRVVCKDCFNTSKHVTARR